MYKTEMIQLNQEQMLISQKKAEREVPVLFRIWHKALSH